MQVTSGTSSTPYPSFSAKSDTSSDLAHNALFQNMLKDPDISKYVEREPDGSYEMMWAENTPMNSKQFNALSLIRSAGAPVIPFRDATVVYLPSDLDLFKKMTGYNLIISEGSMICDDFGNDVRPGDVEKAEAARTLIDSVASARAQGKLSNSPLKLGDMPDVLSTYGGTFGASFDLEEAVLKDLMKALGATEAQVAQLRRSQSEDINGEAYVTWNLPDNLKFETNGEDSHPTDELLGLLL